MPDFGSAGTRTVHTSIAGLELAISEGEHLFYNVRVEGGESAFVFACQHKTLLSSTDFPDHPKSVYEWTRTLDVQPERGSRRLPDFRTRPCLKT